MVLYHFKSALPLPLFYYGSPYRWESSVHTHKYTHHTYTYTHIHTTHTHTHTIYTHTIHTHTTHTHHTHKYTHTLTLTHTQTHIQSHLFSIIMVLILRYKFSILKHIFFCFSWFFYGKTIIGLHTLYTSLFRNIFLRYLAVILGGKFDSHVTRSECHE